jgi:hypothetical protein
LTCKALIQEREWRLQVKFTCQTAGGGGGPFPGRLS